MKLSVLETRGVISLELVFGVTLVALVLTYSVHALTRFLTVGEEVAEKTQALYFAEEGLELMRFVRDEDWSDISGLSNGTDYYAQVTPSGVTLSTTATTTGGFTRTLRVAPVYRDANDDVVSSGGSADSDSKIVTSTVTYDGGSESVVLTTILGNLIP